MDPQAALHLVILTPDWRPRHRLGAGPDWSAMIRQLLDHDANWIALHQRRPDLRGALPDAHDIALTRAMHRRLRPLDIRMADHVIESPHGRFSFRAAGLL